MRSGAAAGLQVRAVGAGHSFTPVAATDGVHLHLDRLNAFERVAPQADGTTHVTVGAGIRLGALNAELAARGLGMRNLGDIDKQSIAGAISTGTHGTGARLGGLATQVVGARIVTAKGEVLETCPESNPELFELARLGLGSVGVLSAVTLEVVPAFKLEAVEEPWAPRPRPRAARRTRRARRGQRPLRVLLVPAHAPRADQAEQPGSRRRRAPAQPGARLDRRRAARPTACSRVANRLATLAPRATAGINDLAARALSSRRFVAPSPEVFVSPRRVRFREMEYAVPRDQLVPRAGGDRPLARGVGRARPFPVEVRFAAADDLWLSTAHGRETAYIAVHQYIHLPFERYFRAVEQIVAPVGGPAALGQDALARGRRASASSTRASPTRSACGQQADPDGVFSNPYLARLFGA